MPDAILTIDLTRAESASDDAIQKFLRDQEELEQTEVIGWRLAIAREDATVGINSALVQPNADLAIPSDLEVVSFPNDATADAAAKEALRGKRAVAYEHALIGGQRRLLLITRPGEQILLRGKMSTFGGAADRGMREDEGLAIVNAANFATYTRYFVGGQMGGSIPLGRNLDPETYYLACRWDRDVTPYARLKDCTIRVRHPLSGKEIQAEAVDYGPGPQTGRITDLSPRLARDLALDTDDECIVTIVLPPDLRARAPRPAPVDGGGGGVGAVVGVTAGLQVFGQRELIAHFGAIEPVRENGDGSFEIRNSTFRANIVEADISPLRGIKGVPNDGTVECHRKIKEPLEDAVRAIVAAGLRDRIVTWDGLFVPRHILWDSSRAFSTHSWAVAFDINAHWNGFDARPAPVGSKGSLRELVPIFAAHGFTWGGHWKKPDGMHFQYGRA